MYKVKILIKNHPIFLGIYDSEKRKRNRVDIQIEYFEKTYIDYSEVYKIVEKTLKDKKFSLMEELLEQIEMDLKKFFKNRTTFKVIIRKIKPYRMKFCDFVEMEKCKKI
uniref:Dihydroneopterin aldolase/epimerase domain-containing protein n=1 Tax=candidate division WOR-3 bacterium TaxID=2052148 RepID=A0A7C3J7A2_UNCW3